MDVPGRRSVQSLWCLADSVEASAQRAVQEAITNGESLRRWRAQLLLELARVGNCSSGVLRRFSVPKFEPNAKTDVSRSGPPSPPSIEDELSV
jgi:hypothetical protein